MGSIESLVTKSTGVSKLLTSTFWSNLLSNFFSLFSGMFFYVQSLFSYKLDFSNGAMPGLENFSFRSVFTTNNSVFTLLSHEIITLSLLFRSFFTGLKAFAVNLLLISPFNTLSLFSPSAYTSSLLNGLN